MHEMSIAIPLVKQLEAVAAEHGAARVEAVGVAAGQMRQVVPEMLVSAFEVAAADTCVEGAMLEVTIVPPVAQCRHCQLRFDASIDSVLCPGCNQADVNIVEGNEITLMSVTLEKPDED